MVMEAVLKIYGDIGTPDKMMEMFGISDGATDATMVMNFLEQNKEADSITVRINSRGGDVQEGWSIYDLLTNSGKKVKTICEGKVYSIATIVFLAGSEREMMKNADGLIHNPYIPPETLMGAYGSGDLLRIAEGLKQEEEKILDFYAQKTGTDKAKLAEYMKDDTKLSAEDMLSLGFATKILEPIIAYAYVKPKINIMDEKAFFEKLGSTLDGALAKIANFSRLDPKDQTLVDKDGKEFKLDKETGGPAVGDKASPDGTFTMSSGQVITISAGVVTTIAEPEDEKTELDLAKEKIADLEAKLVASEAGKPDLVAAEASFKAKEVEAVALVTELTALKNSYKPESRTRFTSAVDKVGDVDLNKVRELRKKSSIKTE
jgi:ATP-dependent Clp protease protease subunit